MDMDCNRLRNNLLGFNEIYSATPYCRINTGSMQNKESL